MYERAFDRPTFDAMKRKLDAELVALNAARSAAFGDELDAAALVDYGIHVVTNAGTLWRDAALD